MLGRLLPRLGSQGWYRETLFLGLVLGDFYASQNISTEAPISLPAFFSLLLTELLSSSLVKFSVKCPPDHHPPNLARPRADLIQFRVS